MIKGKLIVIDGTDGSGKATQVARLKERLRADGMQVHSLDFPRYYDNFFGKFIGEALRGDYGDWAHLHPKIASIIYANDRAESADQIRSWVDAGNIVILDRYVSSNQIHQGGKINDQQERKEFMQWLDTLEHKVLGIPRPDMIIYLDVPIPITQKLLLSKENQESKQYLGGAGDQHENDLDHLENAKQSGLKMIAENNHWVKINCTENGKMRSIQDISDTIYLEISQII